MTDVRVYILTLQARYIIAQAFIACGAALVGWPVLAGGFLVFCGLADLAEVWSALEDFDDATEGGLWQ